MRDGLRRKPLQQPLDEARGGCGITVLNQDIEHDAVLVDGRPKVAKHTRDTDKHLVQVADVSRSGSPPQKTPQFEDDPFKYNVTA